MPRNIKHKRTTQSILTVSAHFAHFQIVHTTTFPGQRRELRPSRDSKQAQKLRKRAPPSSYTTLSACGSTDIGRVQRRVENETVHLHSHERFVDLCQERGSRPAPVPPPGRDQRECVCTKLATTTCFAYHHDMTVHVCARLSCWLSFNTLAPLLFPTFPHVHASLLPHRFVQDAPAGSAFKQEHAFRLWTSLGLMVLAANSAQVRRPFGDVRGCVYACRGERSGLLSACCHQLCLLCYYN
jgi:hypothetical protein